LKIHEILHLHATYHELTPELIQRAFCNFLDELDPNKIYFLDTEIDKWINPSPELLELTLKGVQREDFHHFQELYDKIAPAISRRIELEREIPAVPLEIVTAGELRDLPYATTEEELRERLHKIRSAQLSAMAKLSQEDAAQLKRRLEKRRQQRDTEIFPLQIDARKRVMLSLVLKSVTAALDSQTNYLTPAEADQFMIQVEQKLYGVGAQLRDDLDGFTIMRLIEGGPALLSGKLKIGDKIIAVNHEPVVGMDIVDAVGLIRGKEGSTVTLTVLRRQTADKEPDTVDVDVGRAEVILKETRLETKLEPFGKSGIAYLHLFSFYQDGQTSSAEDLRTALKELQKVKNIEGIILDLRNNAGGLLPQAVAVTSLFIDRGIVVSIQDNTGAIQHLRSLGNQPLWEGPLIVLVNHWSASAAEIVAQTLQDYKRAIVVGDEKTYGKGTFQTFTLDNAHRGKINPKGEYKVTRGRYFTVSGKSPQIQGVRPDIIVSGPFAKMHIGEEFAKYPLSNATIPDNFHDDLSDLSPWQRLQLGPSYHERYQSICTTDHLYLPLLKENSKERIASNGFYQTFLTEYEKEEPSYELFQDFSQHDPQLLETYNIMKDLILLMAQDNRELAS
jgi:carboxyl-terminal processing protease